MFENSRITLILLLVNKFQVTKLLFKFFLEVQTFPNFLSYKSFLSGEEVVDFKTFAKPNSLNNFFLVE